ncbi:cupredoxin domain-containing protein [Cryomorphaceae bacterium 1068]|nr:cupredoxin domain-containing protein [Cryomorphaceae bacterium 1068]
MKKYITFTLAFVALIFTSQAFAQKAETVKLTQVEGAFEETELMLEAGTYVFEVANDGVDHEVGFVIVPKGKTEMSDHIKEAYVQKMIADGQTSTSKEVTLAAGEYEYFCPMNPTPHYTLVVK